MAAYYSQELSQKIQHSRAINASKHLSLGSNPSLGFTSTDKQIIVDEANSHHIEELGLAMNIKELGVTKEMLPGLEQETAVTEDGYKVLTAAEILEIFKQSM